MSLSEKYRPRKLDEIVGNTQVREWVESRVAIGRFPNSILLSGPVGDGKTTFARILAKHINCEHLTNCEECERCGYNVGNSRFQGLSGIRELDMAQNSSKEHLIKLCKLSTRQTLVGPPNVFICDEVQALRNDAFNAWLKSLETDEPVYWILVTSEPHKLPETIRSRCMQLEMVPPTSDETGRYLQKIAKNEGVKIRRSDVQYYKALASKALGVRQSIQQLELYLGPLLQGERPADLWRLAE